MSTIVIVGAGMMGSGICFPASDNGNDIRLVGTPYDKEVIARIKADGFHPRLGMKLPEGVTAWYYEEMEQAFDGMEMVVSGVPSFGVEWFAENVLVKVPDDVKVLSLTKGLQEDAHGALLPISSYYANYLSPERKLSINSIGGPCISMELCQKRHTTVALCGDDIRDLQWIQSLLQTPYYHINLTLDVPGIECAVALKNAYAVGVSLAIGFAETHGEQLFNPQASLFGQAVREMLRFTKIMGGHTDAVIYATSDLYVTIAGGRNRKLGELLGQGLTFKEAMQKLSGVTLESVSIITRAARSVRHWAEQGRVTLDDYPLLLHLDAIINGDEPVNIPWKLFG